MNTHFQLFCIFEDFYNKVLGKKTMLASKSLLLLSLLVKNNSQQYSDSWLFKKLYKASFIGHLSFYCNYFKTKSGLFETA